MLPTPWPIKVSVWAGGDRYGVNADRDHVILRFMKIERDNNNQPYIEWEQALRTAGDVNL